MRLRYLLDTNVVSEPLRPQPRPTVLERLAAAGGALAIPSVVWHELVFGVERLAPSRRKRYLAAYLAQTVAPTMAISPYDEPAAAWHAAERARLAGQGRTPPFVNGQIAAIAATTGLTLVNSSRSAEAAVFRAASR